MPEEARATTIGRRGLGGSAPRLALRVRQAARAWPLLLVGALTLAGLALRVWRNDWALPFVPHPDEPAIMNTVLGMLRTGDPNPHFFLYPSLWIYVQALVAALHLRWGIWQGLYASAAQLPATTDIVTSVPGFFAWGRVATAVVGAATIPALFGLARRYGGTLAGLIAAALLAVNPLQLIHAHYVMTDVPCAFFTAAALLATLSLYERGRWRDYLLAGAMAGLAAGAKHQAALTAVVITVAAMMRCAPGSPRSWARELPRLLAAALSMIGVFLLTSPYIVLAFDEFWADLSYQLRDYAAGAHGDVTGPWPWRAYLAFYRERALGLPAALLALWGVGTLLLRRDPRVALLLALLLAYLLVFLPQGNHWMRNLLPTQIPLLALAGVGGADLLRRTHQRLPRPLTFVLGAALLVILLSPATESLRYLQRLQQGDSRVALLRWITSAVPPGVQVAAELKPVPGDERWVEATYLPQHDRDWYRRQGYAYVVASSDTWRQLAIPEIYQRFGGDAIVAEFSGAAAGRLGPRFVVYSTGLTPDAVPQPLAERVTLGGAQLLGGAVGVPEGDAVTPGVRPSATFTAGATLALRTFWQVRAPLDRDYFIFVHVVDAAGTVVAQRDAPPWQGRAPTSSWQPGSLVVDVNDIALPPTLAPGVYTIRVGMFDPASGQSPPLTIDDQPVGGNAATLDTITVVP